MASNLSISSSYAGELALPYISAAVLSGDTIANNYVTVKENVKFKMVLKTLASTGIVKAWGCDFNNADTTLTLAERVLQVTDLKVNVEVCKAQFASDWEAAQTGRGFINNVIPANFADFVIAHLSGKVAENIEYTLWQGNFEGSSFTSFNGILKVLDTAKGGTPDVDFANAFTAANVVASLTSLANALPATLLGDTTVKLFINRKTAQLYRQALSALGYLQQFNAASNYPLMFDGYEIYVCPGIPDNVALFAKVDNLFFGTDLVSDFNEVKVVDMSVTDGSDNVRMVMKFRAGTQVAIPAEAILGFMNP
jgi:hypothetical protein